MKPQVLMYTTRACSYCQRADRLLEAKGLTDVARIYVDREPGPLQQRAAGVGAGAGLAAHDDRPRPHLL